MQGYFTVQEKLALTLESSRVSKNTAVKQFGIGEDLAFTLFGWVGDSLAVVSNMHYSKMRIDPFERVKLVHKAACMIRKTWGVTDFTFMAEAFCSFDIDQTRNKDLRELFIQGEIDVRECLTFTHVNDNDVEVVSMPYRYIPLKDDKIEWDKPLHNSSGAGLRNVEIVQSMMHALTLKHAIADEPEALLPELYNAAVIALEVIGFSTQWDFI